MAAAWERGPTQAQADCPLGNLGTRVLDYCKLWGCGRWFRGPLSNG